LPPPPPPPPLPPAWLYEWPVIMALNATLTRIVAIVDFGSEILNMDFPFFSIMSVFKSLKNVFSKRLT
jgi:hypothetical protein